MVRHRQCIATAARNASEGDEVKKISCKSLIGVACLQACIAAPAVAHPPALHSPPASASALPLAAGEVHDPTRIANAFAAALAKGDEAMVRSLLAEDVVIYESGGQESSRREYTSHHMKSDMAFLAALKIQVLEQTHGGDDEVAWVLTRSRLSGTYEGKAVDLYSTESLVLKRSAGKFRIVHVHWSSRPAEATPASTQP